MSSTSFNPTPTSDGSNSGAVAAIGSIIGILVFFLGFGIVIRRLINSRNEKTQSPSLFLHQQFQVQEAAASPAMEKLILEMIEKEKPIRFTAQQLHHFTNNYSSPLGSGGFGVVYKGQFPNQVKIAVKVLKRSSDSKAEEQFIAEIGTIGQTNHINLGCILHLSLGKKHEIEWGKLHDIAIGTAKGLAYLHEECQQRIIHYDIKPANILLDSKFSPKVGDFGLAKLCNRDSTHISLTGYRGTPGYSAPEFLLHNYTITYKCDVYSFGMLLFEIVGRKRNAGITDSGNPDWFPQHVWDKYEKGELEELVRNCGVEDEDKERAIRMCKVALWCVQDNPDGRPPMSASVKMLEGGVEISPPPKPFRYLSSFSRGANVMGLEESNAGSSSLDYSTSNGGSNSHWYKETTPIMKKYEIEMASS